MRRGGNSLRAVAQTLREEGHRTRPGQAWTAVQVRNVLRRADLLRPDAGRRTGRKKEAGWPGPGRSCHRPGACPVRLP
ncbi:recombinase family protein [Deinococcus aestuarii]|uniref:recombinase family protein n=1 Tax=Deinococcus aestuarii TaxID=2774531 RepID=UPI003CCE8D0A